MVQKAPKTFIAGSQLLHVLIKTFLLEIPVLGKGKNLRLLEVDENRSDQETTIDEPCHIRLQSRVSNGTIVQQTHYHNLTFHSASG